MIQVIVFSKNRPLQLHGYLSSFFKHWRGDEVRVDLLIREQFPYEDAYRQVLPELANVESNVRGSIYSTAQQDDFASDLSELLRDGRADHVCFGCDDAVFTAPVDVAAIEHAFKDPDLLGVSMRLGRTIKRGMFGDPMSQPSFIPAGVLNEFDEQPLDPSLEWDVRTAPAGTDWAYPWELIGTVYDGDYARKMVEALTFNSPNTLEHAGSLAWDAHTDRYLMRAYPIPRLVLSAVNVVQTDFPNGIVGAAELTPEYLLDLWNKGIRLDVDEFAHRAKTLDTWRIGNLWLSRQKVLA